MSYEEKAMAALEAAANEPLRAVAMAVKMAVRAQESIREANSIEAKAGAYALMVLACEAMKKAADEAYKTLRPASAQAMEETGCEYAYLPGRVGVVSLCEGTETARATDESLIEEEFWSKPKPPPRRPNTVLAAQRLRKGLPAPGFELVPAHPHIMIKMKEHA